MFAPPPYMISFEVLLDAVCVERECWSVYHSVFG